MCSKSNKTCANRADITRRLEELFSRQGLRYNTEIGELIGVSRETIRRGRQNHEWSRQTIRDLARALETEEHYILQGPASEGQATTTPEGDYEIPTMGRAAADSSGGRMVEFDHEAPPVHISRNTAAVEIRGESLSPVAWDGQHVLVDTTEGQDLGENDLVVIETEDGSSYARRYHETDGQVTLTPVNPAYRGESVTLDEEQITRAHRIIGVLFE